jgi:hypothetical protein
MKKLYENPEIEFIMLDQSDVITASSKPGHGGTAGGNGPIGGGAGGDNGGWT